MKKFAPYLLAYFIVATCTAIYPYFYRHLITGTPHVLPRDSVAVVVNPGISRDKLVARLQQVGLSAAEAEHVPIVRPAPVATTLFHLAYHYTFEAVIFAAFAGLVVLFQKKLSRDVSGQGRAA